MVQDLQKREGYNQNGKHNNIRLTTKQIRKYGNTKTAGKNTT